MPGVENIMNVLERNGSMMERARSLPASEQGAEQLVDLMATKGMPLSRETALEVLQKLKA